MKVLHTELGRDGIAISIAAGIIWWLNEKEGEKPKYFPVVTNIHSSPDGGEYVVCFEGEEVNVTLYFDTRVDPQCNVLCSASISFTEIGRGDAQSFSAQEFSELQAITSIPGFRLVERKS